MNWLISILVVGIMWSLSFKYPYRPEYDIVEKDSYELRSKYQQWEFYGIFIFIIIVPLYSYIIKTLLVKLATTITKIDNEAIYQINTPELMWYLPSVAIAYSFPLYNSLFFFYTKFLKTNINEYIHFQKIKYGTNGVKPLRALSWILAIVASITIGLFLDFSIKIKKDSIIVDEILPSADKILPFSKIENIYFLKYIYNRKKDEYTNRPHFLIKFKNDYVYDTEEGLADYPDKQKEIALFISKVSEIKIDTAKYE